MKKIIQKIDNLALKKLQSEILGWCNEYSGSNLISLDDLHKSVEMNSINELRLYLFNHLNNNYNWKKALIEIFGDELTKILGPDISVQNKINFSIKFPGDATSNLGMHSDSWSAESPFQINSWIPLTDVSSTNGMYVLDAKRTFETTRSITENSFFEIPNDLFHDEDFLSMNFGEILIFNPCLLHGNVSNTTNKTRVSLHVRFKSIYSPENSEFPDRTTGIFYEPLLISENSKFALEYINAANGSIIQEKFTT